MTDPFYNEAKSSYQENYYHFVEKRGHEERASALADDLKRFTIARLLEAGCLLDEEAAQRLDELATNGAHSLVSDALEVLYPFTLDDGPRRLSRAESTKVLRGEEQDAIEATGPGEARSGELAPIARKRADVSNLYETLDHFAGLLSEESKQRGGFSSFTELEEAVERTKSYNLTIDTPGGHERMRARNLEPPRGPWWKDLAFVASLTKITLAVFEAARESFCPCHPFC